MRPEPKVGSIVFVMNGSGRESMGFGVYLGKVKVHTFIARTAKAAAEDLVVVNHLPEIEPQDSVKAERAMQGYDYEPIDSPKILLARTKEVVFGFQCWWVEIDVDDVSNILRATMDPFFLSKTPDPTYVHGSYANLIQLRDDLNGMIDAVEKTFKGVKDAM